MVISLVLLLCFGMIYKRASSLILVNTEKKDEDFAAEVEAQIAAAKS